MQQDRTYTYKIEADKQKVEIQGIEPDLDCDPMGDSTHEANKTNTNYSQGRQNISYLNFTNMTNFTTKFIAKTLPNLSDKWVERADFFSIAPGKKVKFGDNAEEYFYYYNSYFASNSNMLKWDGCEANIEIVGVSTYNLRKINLSAGPLYDQNNCNVHITLK
jgi:hypothetical protein